MKMFEPCNFDRVCTVFASGRVLTDLAVLAGCEAVTANPDCLKSDWLDKLVSRINAIRESVSLVSQTRKSHTGHQERTRAKKFN